MSSVSHIRTLATRRNKWVCALKTALAEVKIYGSAGDGAPPPPTKYTLVPYEEVVQHEKEAKEAPSTEAATPVGGWKLEDKNAALGELLRLDSLSKSKRCYSWEFLGRLSRSRRRTSRPLLVQNILTFRSQLRMTNPRQAQGLRFKETSSGAPSAGPSSLRQRTQAPPLGRTAGPTGPDELAAAEAIELEERP